MSFEETGPADQLATARRPDPLAADQLELLVHSPSVPVRVHAARRLDLNFEQALTLAADPSPEVRLAALGNSQVPVPESIDAVIAGGDRQTRRNLARRSDLDDGDIELLLTDPDPVVREMLAGNATLGRHWLEMLLTDESWHVRAALARRLEEQPWLAERLLTDPDWSVRARAATWADASAIDVAALADDVSTGVRESLARNSTVAADLLSILAADETADVRVVVAGRSDLTAEQLSALADDPDHAVRAAVARNPRPLPDGVLLRLVGDSSQEVRRAAAMRSQTFTAEVLQGLADHDPDLLAYRSEDLTIEQYGQLANSGDRRIRTRAAAHPHLPVGVLARLAVDKATAVRREVARRGDLPPDLEAALADDPERSVRRVIERRRAET